MDDNFPALAASGLAPDRQPRAMVRHRRHLLLAVVALAACGCARSENAKDPSDRLGADIARRDRDQAESATRREADMIEAGQRGRAAAARDVARAEAAEANRQAAQ
ncbi:MAG: hypothetical protein ACXWUN_05600 [Allosphingosinicella sp.]